MSDEGDRFVAWRLGETQETFRVDPEDDRMEHALLAYAQQSATRVGAEWFAAEFARREEEERLQREVAIGPPKIVDEPVPESPPEVTLVDASVEDDVLGGAPEGIGFEPVPPPAPPAKRHPHVPRPPAPDPAPEPKRRRRDRKLVEASTRPTVISAPEWARMSPGARRLYGLDA